MADRRVGLGFAALILLALVWIDGRVITGTPNTADGAQYERLAVELARSGRFATAGTLTREVEPLHVALLAAQIRLDPRLADTRATGLVGEGRASRAVKQQNLLWAGLLLTGTAAQVLLLRRGRRDRSLLAGIAVVVVTLAVLENPDIVDRNLAELPAAALVVWAGVLATRTVERPTSRHAALLGVLIGLLALTRAVFAYVAVPYALGLALLVGLGLWPRVGPAPAARRIGALLLVGMAGYAAIVGPWMLRNAAAFGDVGIAERGGQVLSIRASKNDMDEYQLRGAIVHWTATEARPPLARLLGVDLADFAADRPLAVLMRDDEDERAREQSLYRLVNAAIEARASELMAEGLEEAAAFSLAEAEAGEEALRRLRERPARFLRTTPAFLWRFSWPMNLSTSVPRLILALLNPLGMAAIILAAGSALIQRHAVRFAVVGLPAGTAAFYALVTHALPRYARPLAPTMIILLVLGAAALWDRMRPGRRPD
jgi:hypothetical protein